MGGSSSFDLIMQEVLNQKQRLDELVEENQDLQRQLADLRAGRGILLEIGGQRFALNEIAAVATTSGVEWPVQEPVNDMAKSTPLMNEAATGGEVDGDISLPQAAQPADGEAAPLNGGHYQEIQAAVGGEETGEKAPAHTTFLEDLLVDEFATAATSPMLAWKGAAAAGESSPRRVLPLAVPRLMKRQRRPCAVSLSGASY